MAQESDPPRGDGRAAEALAADWLRDLLRAAKMARMYRADSPLVIDARRRVARALQAHLERFGEWTFQVTPGEILLDDIAVVKPDKGAAAGEPGKGGGLAQLPFLLYRDGVRAMTFSAGIPDAEVDALLDALCAARAARPGDDDLVTALWQANPTHLKLDTVPIEQTLFVSSGKDGGGEADRGQGLGFGLAPRTTEIRAALGGPGGPAGLHKETGFEAWLDALLARAQSGDAAARPVSAAYAALANEAAPAREALVARWQAESARSLVAEASALLPRVRAAMGDAPEAAAAIARYAVSGVGQAMDRAAWREACEALELVRALDPRGEATRTSLAALVAEKTSEDYGESLDEAEPDEQGRFLAFAVELGTPGVGLALAALASAQRSRTRAALSTALCYLCSEDPSALAEGLASPHSEVARCVVSVLGQIGGDEVAPMLASAMRHAAPSVRREAAAALAALPESARLPLLAGLLGAPDAQTLPAALRVARLAPHPRVARALLALVEGNWLEDRGDELKGAVFTALGDVAGDDLVPALEATLTHGGWFARGSWRRTGVARVLARMDTPAAEAALQRAARHGS